MAADKCRLFQSLVLSPDTAKRCLRPTAAMANCAQSLSAPVAGFSRPALPSVPRVASRSCTARNLLHCSQQKVPDALSCSRSSLPVLSTKRRTLTTRCSSGNGAPAPPWKKKDCRWDQSARDACWIEHPPGSPDGRPCSARAKRPRYRIHSPHTPAGSASVCHRPVGHINQMLCSVITAQEAGLLMRWRCRSAQAGAF